jgi:hypothetical protein
MVRIASPIEDESSADQWDLTFLGAGTPLMNRDKIST